MGLAHEIVTFQLSSLDTINLELDFVAFDSRDYNGLNIMCLYHLCHELSLYAIYVIVNILMCNDISYLILLVYLRYAYIIFDWLSFNDLS